MFRTAQEAELSYEHGAVELHDIAEYRNNKAEGGHILTTVGRIIYNDRIERALGEALGDDFDLPDYEFVNRSMKKRDCTQVVDELVQKYGAASISAGARRLQGPRVPLRHPGGHHDLQERRRRAAGQGGDPRPLRERGQRGRGPYDMGLITQEERHESVTDKWQAATDEVAPRRWRPTSIGSTRSS